MQDLTKYYPIENLSILENFLKAYLPLVDFVVNSFGLSLSNPDFEGDHLGLQVLSAQEFDECHRILMNYSTLIYSGIIHDRRNNVYKFSSPLEASPISMPKIEIFEPKPDANLSKLRPGIEHIAFIVKDYDLFYTNCQKSNCPVDKFVDFGGSKFFKTRFMNCIEVEFRNDGLGD